MFNFLKGSKTELMVKLDRPGLVYVPGDVVNARITVENDKELKIQGGRFVVLAREGYKYQEETTETDSEGNSSSSVQETWGYKEKEVFRFDFLPEGPIPPGKHTYETSFTLPADAAPTVNGNIVTLNWYAKATLDRRLASDINKEIEFRLLAITPSSLTPAGDYGASNEPGEAAMAFNLPNKEFINNCALMGSLKIMPNKPFDVSEIRLELVRWEYVPNVGGCGDNKNETTVVKLKLAGKTHLEEEQFLEFNFNAQLPIQIPPSVQLSVGSIGYKLKGILSRALRKDTMIEEEVYLYTGSIG